MISNQWLKEAEYKKLFQDIDATFLEIWSDDGTFADFVHALSDEQKKLLGEMKLKDGNIDLDEFQFNIGLVRKV